MAGPRDQEIHPKVPAATRRASDSSEGTTPMRSVPFVRAKAQAPVPKSPMTHRKMRESCASGQLRRVGAPFRLRMRASACFRRPSARSCHAGGRGFESRRSRLESPAATQGSSRSRRSVIRLRRHYNATTPRPRIEAVTDRLLGVPRQVTVGAVDHLHAGAHYPGQLEDRDPAASASVANVWWS